MRGTVWIRDYSYAAALYARRRGHWKRLNHNQQLGYDKIEDCYLHKHHHTVTVKIYRDKYAINTGGWNTCTTWAKIHDACPPLSMRGRPSSAYLDSKFVTWIDDKGRHFVPFYDGIEIDTRGVPLEHKPCRKRRLKPGALDEFNKIAKDVRRKLVPRAMAGEFDDYLPVTAASSEHLLNLMMKVYWDDFPKRDMVLSLFVQRPKMAFGRQVRNLAYGNTEVPAWKRLESNINAARRAFVTTAMYEEVEVIV